MVKSVIIDSLKGFEEFRDYYIRDNGEVISQKFNSKTKIAKVKSGRGYQSVNLSNGNKRLKVYVHRLVALAFIKNPDNKPEVNHIDEDKTNNKASNLNWMTRKENVNHGTGAKRSGLSRSNVTRDNRGAKHFRYKPKEYYGTKTSFRGSFKITCKRHGWNFEDFEEFYSGEKVGYSKKYYYKLKED